MKLVVCSYDFLVLSFLMIRHDELLMDLFFVQMLVYSEAFIVGYVVWACQGDDYFFYYQ